jgi:hypothetical protein
MTAFLTFMVVRFSGLVEDSELCFACFLRGFACDAQSGDRARLQPLDSYFAVAFLASSVRAVLDSRECLADLAEQLALAIAHPQQEITIRLERGAVGRVRRSLVLHVIHATDRALGFLKDVALAAFEQLSEELEVSLPHG